MGLTDKMSSFGSKMTDQVSKITHRPVLVLQANFYQDIGKMLADAAIEEIENAALRYKLIEVPGVFELPAAVSLGIAHQKFGAFVALGCVIRGETTHYDYVCEESARGLNHLAMTYRLPLGYGVITAENMEQALARADRNGKNVGGRAAIAAVSMMNIKAMLPPPKPKPQKR
ncbi:MAG: 6,7-dimethyl-8-ribityllumazine synthase [Rickettsiales bacterium]|nr:6,7-dimethyl-8-ribityllumazine synthase [Rickettsiales bacterium]